MNSTIMKSTLIDFDPATGLSRNKKPIRRYLSNMAGMFMDESAFDKMLKRGDPVVYEFYDMGVPESEKEIAYGTSITYPGKIGMEYFMTKGHFHTVLDTAEVYYCLRGHGYMLMESQAGDWEIQDFKPGLAVYVPPSYAHRSINISSSEPLITFFAFPGNAGHDYGTIESKGFRKLVVEHHGEPKIIDNPKWKS